MTKLSTKDFDVVQNGRTVEVTFRPSETTYTFHARLGPLAEGYGVYYGAREDLDHYRKSDVFEFAKAIAKAKLNIN